VSRRRSTHTMKRGDSIETSTIPVIRERTNRRATVVAIEEALAELGIHAKLSDIVAKARLIENGIRPSRSRGKPEHQC